MVTKSHRILQSETTLQFNELPLQQKQAWFSDTLITLNYILCKRRHFSFCNSSWIGTVLCLFVCLLETGCGGWCVVFVLSCFLPKSSSNLETNNFLPSSCQQSLANTTGQVLNFYVTIIYWQSLSFFLCSWYTFYYQELAISFFWISEGKYKNVIKFKVIILVTL